MEETKRPVANINDALRSDDVNVFGILTVTSTITVLVTGKSENREADWIRNSLDKN